MFEHSLKLLEYDRLLELLAGYAQSGPGSEYCRCLTPDLAPEDILDSWKMITEAGLLLNLSGRPALGGFEDITDLLDRLTVDGIVFQPAELYSIFHAARTCRLVKTHIRTLEDAETRTPGLYEISESLPVFSDFEKAVERSMSQDGEILDTASTELAKIRRELAGMRTSIHSRLSGLMRMKDTESALQDDIITQRGGRYVIPVKTSLTRDVPGLVHDYSASGATAYVEPFEMVGDNNRLNLLRKKESREIERILRNLTQSAAALSVELEPAFHILVYLDCLFAQAAMSRSQKALAPSYDPEKGLELKEARHPLLLARRQQAATGETVIPLDIKITPEERLLVISGINAGGKTVALKTLGLLILMAQTGLHLPVAEGSQIRFFDQILASIGDEQDLQTDLSTFSGHIRRISEFLDKATPDSLVLLDELGTGTDPAEGAALALAILDELRLRGSWVLTATHYHMLKAWGQMAEGVQNAAVRTDASGRPTYGIDYGLPGFSSGLAMARELGIPPEIVEKAENYLDDGQRKTVELMTRLEEERARLNESRARVRVLENQLEITLERNRKTEQERTETFNKQVESLKDDVRRALSRAENEFKSLRQKFKDKETPTDQVLREFRDTQNELRKHIPAVMRKKDEPLKQVEPGHSVMVESLGREGTVLSVNPIKKTVEVDVAGMKVKAQFSDLSRPGNQSLGKEKKREFVLPAVSHPPREINLIGKTVEEALPVVDKSLDLAHVGGVRNLYIIHGIGTGKLREAVRVFLHDDSRVKEFQRAEPAAGGEGVTVVTMAD